MLDKIFNPKSIALIGASNTPGKVGYSIAKNLESYQGKIIPVNIKGEIKVLEEYVDLVIIALPSKFVIPEIDRCGKLGIKNIVVISAGFKEVGNFELENQLIEVVKKYDINMIGANTFGIANGKIDLNATFGDMPKGFNKISLLSQSGAVIASINDMANKMGIGFSKMVSLGNKATFTELDMIKYLRDDPDTDVIIGYLEEIKNGPEFIEVASEIEKPIILIKAGRTAKGGAAAASHTGSIAGSDVAYEAALEKAGILRVKSVSDLLLYAKVLESQPIPKGNKIGIVTNGGGAGIMATDDAIDAGFELPEMTKEFKEELLPKLLVDSSVKNPIDILGAGIPDHYKVAVESLVKDKNIDGVIVLSCPQTVIPREEIESAINSVESDKPIVHTFDFEDEEVKAMEALFKYAEIVNRPNWSDYQAIKPDYVLPDRDVLGVESFDFLEAYKIDVVKDFKLGEDIKYPVVAKVVDEKVSHKSDAGGVRLNIQSEEELRDVIQELLLIGDDVQVQQMVSGKEVIIGMIRDPTFGPMIMVGLGGIYVEVLKDVQFGIAPIGIRQAMKMIKSLKTYKLLEGVRGEEGIDMYALAMAIVAFGKMALDHPEIKEMEINPLMVSKDGAVAVDFRAMR